MGEWKKVKLSDLGTIIGGATPSTSREDYYNGNIPWITPKDLSTHKGRYISKGERNITEDGLKNCSAQMLPTNSILFSSRAPIGYVAIASNPVCTNQGFKSIVPNAKTDAMFLYYLLTYNKDAIEAMGSGTTFKEVSGSTMRNIEVRVPIEKTEQTRIASVLSAIDAKIENNEQINDNLQQQVSALFNNWFVDFGHFDGDMPIDWHIGKLADIANVTSGKRPPLKSSEKTASATIPLIGAASVMGYTSDTLYDSPILVTGRVGTHGVVQRFYSPCWPSDNTLVITSPYYEFTDQVLRRVDYINMNRGSTQPLITQTDLKNVEIVIPSDSVLKEFESLANTLMQKHAENCQENQRLCELRDALLPRLMSGEIDVSDVQI